MSKVAATAILRALFQKSTPGYGVFASPPDLYIGLFTAAPISSDTGSALTAKEATYTSYARVAADPSDFNEVASDSGLIDNANELAFPQATGGSSLCTYAAICDAASGGNMIAYGLLAPSALQDFIAETEDAEFVCPGHGFADTAEVRMLKRDADTALPGGFDANTKYFVRDSTSDSFKLAATSGGTAITITSDGSGRIGIDGSLNVTNNVTPKIAAGNLVLTLK